MMSSDDVIVVSNSDIEVVSVALKKSTSSSISGEDAVELGNEDKSVSKISFPTEQVFELPSTVSPEEAIADLKKNHINSVPEKIRRNKLRVSLDDMKAKKNELPGWKGKEAHGELMVDKIKLDHIKQLKKAFQNAVVTKADRTITGALSKHELRDQIERACRANFLDDEWELIFIKMDVKGHGYVFYDEFMNFLLLEFRLKENLEGEIALWMLETPLQVSPTFIRSHHRHGVVGIAFSPKVLVCKETGLRRFGFANGGYFTVSEQGTINFWSLNLELKNSQECPSPMLRLSKTFVLKIVSLADINLIAISSTERDLRFYDITGRHYQLKTRIVLLPFPATALCYHFYEDIEKESIFAFGDSDGSVSIMKFSCKEGSPLKKFERSANMEYQCITYDSLLKDTQMNNSIRKLPTTLFKNVHAGAWVTMVSFSNKIWRGKELIVTCSNTANHSVVLFDVKEMKVVKKFRVNLGVNTFCLVPDSELLITGGFDTIIRFWHIKSSKKMVTSMSGHYAPIDALYEQHNGARLFSISKDRVIKVWDTKEMICIQTFSAKFQDLGDSPPVYFYNPYHKKCILAANNIAYLTFGPLESTFFSEGNTHVGGVTSALYNPLFDVIVTMGMDSNIMTWDPWRGKLLFVVRNAHAQHVLGEDKPMSISSAIFSPSKVYLLTGAVDGSVKMWNFTIGTCLRTMHLDRDCVVTGLVWVPGRIMACGWNMHVSEWEDEIEELVGLCKHWTTVHTKHILAMIQCGPKAIVTAAYNGELVFYNLQNGHYYNRFFVGKPKLPITMGFSTAFKTDDGSIDRKTELFGDSVSVYTVSSSSTDDYSRPAGISKQDLQKNDFDPIPVRKVMKEKRRQSLTPLRELEKNCICSPPCTCDGTDFKGFAGPDKMEVHCLLFLETRPENPEVGSLFVSLQTGAIQFWSHHPKGGLIDTFFAIHILRDYVTAMATDETNTFLFTGTSVGYVKIWHIANYCVLAEMVTHRSLPSLRLQFPFLWKDKILGRAKRAARGQPEPFLCSSCRNHLGRVMGVELLEQQSVYITCGLDRSVRLWTYSGKFIGVLGGLNPWTCSLDEATSTNSVKIPADLTRVVSSTSFKVLTGRAQTAQPSPVEETDKDDEPRLNEYTYVPLRDQFRGVSNFPEDDSKYQLLPCDGCDVEELKKKIQQPAMRALSMLKPVGQYDFNPPDEDKLVRNIRMLLEDQDRKQSRGRQLAPPPTTRTRPKERWADQTATDLRHWAKKTSQRQLADSINESMSNLGGSSGSGSASQKSSRSIKSTKKTLGLSPDAKNLENLLAEYEESAKGWYRQQT